jgi:hypothetical protein
MLHWLLHHILDIYSWAIPALGWGFNRRRFVSHRPAHRSVFSGVRTVAHARVGHYSRPSRRYSAPRRSSGSSGRRSVFSGQRVTAHAQVSAPARHSSLAGNVAQSVIPMALGLPSRGLPTRSSLFSGVRTTAGYGPRVPYLSTTAAQRGFIRALQLGAPRKTAVALLSAGLKNPSLFHQPGGIKSFLHTAAKYQNAFHNPTYIAAKVAGGNPNDYLSHATSADKLVSSFAHATIKGLPPMGSGANPFGGLKLGRTDMGVDFTGKGPIGAVGPGKITLVATNTGWPGGTFIKQKLPNGRFVYYAEGIKPNVRVGQKVGAGQKIGTATGLGIEAGWAVPGSADLAAAHSIYHEGMVTPQGLSFGRFLRSQKNAPKVSGSAYHQLRQASRAGVKPQLRPAPKPYYSGGYSGQKAVFAQVGRKHNIDPRVLWAIYGVETGHGKLNYTQPHNGGVLGPMQQQPGYYAAHGPTSNVADRMNLSHAVEAAARGLKAAGGGGKYEHNKQGYYKAIFNYNHADWYVRKVLSGLGDFGNATGKRKLIKPKQGQNALLQRAYVVPHKASPPSSSTSTGTSTAPVAVGTSGRSSAPTSTAPSSDPTGLVNTPLDLSALQSFAQPRVSAGIQSPFFSSSVVTPNATPTSVRPSFRAPRPRSRYYR